MQTVNDVSFTVQTVNDSFFGFGNPKVTVHKAKGHSTLKIKPSREKNVGKCSVQKKFKIEKIHKKIMGVLLLETNMMQNF